MQRSYLVATVVTISLLASGCVPRDATGRGGRSGLASASTPNAADPEALLRLADFTLTNGDIDGSIGLYRRAAAIEPMNPSL